MAASLSHIIRTPLGTPNKGGVPAGSTHAAPKTPGTPHTPTAGVAADVAFVGNRFPTYRLSHHGDSDEDLEVQANHDGPVGRRELVSREVQDLLAQQKKLSVRDLASKFERGQAAAQAAAQRIADTSTRETTILGQTLLNTVRQKLEDMRGLVAGGRAKDDLEEALTSVEALAAQWTLREGDFAAEKAEVRKMAALFKQASEDAKKMVEEARALADQEIEMAKNTARRISAVLDKQQENLVGGTLGARDKEELEILKKEVLEARRIKMLHLPTKAMDMEHEIDGLRKQLRQKADEVVRMRKEVDALTMRASGRLLPYKVEGMEQLGGTLHLVKQDGAAAEPDQCSVQWFRMWADGTNKEAITGASKAQYALEPSDVGRIIQAAIVSPDGRGEEIVQTSGPVDPAPGLQSYVEALVKRGGAQFTVVVVQHNDEVVEKRALHILDINTDRVKIARNRKVLVREHFAAGMQVCGARGRGDAAAQGLYFLARKGQSFMLALESERERNAAIMLMRRLAADSNVSLVGPGDRGTFPV